MLRSGVLLSAFAIACGGPAIGYSELDGELQQARCERLARCGVFPDDAACLRYYRVVPDPSLAAAITAGVVGYDGERAHDCVAATAAQGCDLTAHDVHVDPTACAEMFAGTVGGGERCSIDVECISGTCELPAVCPPMACCVGTCRAPQSPGAAGASCARARDCAAGLVCGTDRMCRAPARPGEACGSDRECADGLGCIGVLATMPGTCRALGHAGDACPYLRCADVNLRCDEAAHRCVAMGLPGDPCPDAIECSTGMECDATTKQCRETPTLGMPCDNACGGDAWCMFDRASRGTCVAPLPNTSPCDGYNQCESFYCEQGPLFDECRDPYVCF